MFDYQTLETELREGVLVATVNNPPLNLMNKNLFLDLLKFTAEVEASDQVRVLILESSDPDFFIAHFDIELILATPTDAPAEKLAVLNDFHQMCERLRTMKTPSIAKIAGRVGGGGNELCASCDMRFGVRGKTLINQMEVPLGILPGGTGTQRLPRLIGRGRALEVILGGDDLDAETAAAWGYLNRVFDSTEDMDTFVANLASRISRWPTDSVALAKASVLNSDLDVESGLLEESFLFAQLLRTEAAAKSMRQALKMGAQTREVELKVNTLGLQVADALAAEAGKSSE